MRVLLISTSYPRDAKDWRGVFMRNKVAALARSSDVELDVWLPPGELPAAATPVMTEQESAWLAQLMLAGGISHLLRNGGWRTWAAPARLLHMLWAVYRRRRDVDIYHVNWLQCALPLPPNGKPALISVLGNDLNLLRMPLVTPLLRRAMRGRNVAICPNADWMKTPLQAAFGDVARITPVSFGIDPRWYAIKRNLVDEAPRRWLAITRLTANKLGPLFEWSRGLFEGGRDQLHLFGPMQEPIQVPDWVHYHGSVSADELVDDWFPGAHGLVTLSSHAEGRPQVMLEAMASGLPIVASRMPAHADIVVDGTTGVMCGSREEYAKAIELLGDKPENLRRGEAAREWARREIGTWDDCAERYVSIYRELLRSSADV